MKIQSRKKFKVCHFIWKGGSLKVADKVGEGWGASLMGRCFEKVGTHKTGNRDGVIEQKVAENDGSRLFATRVSAPKSCLVSPEAAGTNDREM